MVCLISILLELNQLPFEGEPIKMEENNEPYNCVT